MIPTHWLCKTWRASCTFTFVFVVVRCDWILFIVSFLNKCCSKCDLNNILPEWNQYLLHKMCQTGHRWTAIESVSCMLACLRKVYRKCQKGMRGKNTKLYLCAKWHIRLQSCRVPHSLNSRWPTDSHLGFWMWKLSQSLTSSPYLVNKDCLFVRPSPLSPLQSWWSWGWIPPTEILSS